MFFPPRLLLLPLAFLGCGGSLHEGGTGPANPPNQGSNATHIQCDLSTTDPATELVFGLSPEDRASLLAELQKGPVAVEVKECRITPVSGCSLQAKPHFLARNKEASTEIKAPADLAQMAPFSAARYVDRAPATYPLDLTISIAGGFDYEKASLEPSAFSACEKATHVISAYSVGAYEIGPKGAPAIEQSGDRATCKEASESGPATKCSELIAVKFLPFAPVLASLKQKSEKVATDEDRFGEEVITKSSTTTAPPKPITTLDGLKQRGGELEEGGVTTTLSTGAPSDGGHGRGQGKNLCDPMDPLCMYNQRGQ